MVNSANAKAMLNSHFPFSEVQTQYIAVYTTKRGRQIALERERSEAFYLWVEKYDQVIEGVSVKNAKNPGKPYSRLQPRNSNLNDKTAPRLKVGNPAWYLAVNDESALATLLRWYQEA